jgi:REP element-mobilizing transposase RayT
LGGRDDEVMSADAEKTLPERKQLRLKYFDYSTPGAYFVTICTKDRKLLFGSVGADSISARMVSETFRKTLEQYDGVEAPISVVMPNHFHAIITIARSDGQLGTEKVRPSISEIIQAFKRYSTIEYIKMVKEGTLPPFDRQIWQRSFYDHIIRNRDDYDEIYKYIHDNPKQWQFDRFYEEV